MLLTNTPACLIKQAGTLVSNIDEVIEVLEKIYDKYDN